jgi:hypothetical protein
MTWIHEFTRRIVRFRAPLCTAALATLAACDAASTLDPAAGETAALDTPALDSLAPAGVDGPSLATRFAGGIPIGTFALPDSWLGSRYNGYAGPISPGHLMEELSRVKARGGKVIINLAGNQKYYTDAAGNFSLTKWKQRVDRYRGVNFGKYITDGTIIGHFMIDEPNDPANWNGRLVSASTLEEMGRYSKQRWGGMATIVRAHPNYFSKNPRYVDAAWAQYLHRRGNVYDYINKQVSDAKNRGLALVVGLNVLKGGSPNGTKMTASEIKSWGGAMLGSSYPCAFISWKHQSSYVSQNSIEDAMSYLRRKAQNRSTKTCRGS